MTPNEFKKFQYQQTQKQIEKLQRAYKYRKESKNKPKKKAKKPVLTYDQLPEKVKKMTHGSLKPPKFIHKKASVMIATILKKVEDVKKAEGHTGKPLYSLIKQGEIANPFEEVVEMQNIIDDPEGALKDTLLAQKRLKAMEYVQRYKERMRNRKDDN
jgi:hypothetical protein